MAIGDVNKDGVADIAVASGPTVKILNGKSGGTLATYTPFPSAKKSVSVALGDVNGDGRSDLLAAAGGRVDVYDGKTHALLVTLTPFGASYHGALSGRGGRREPRREGRRDRRHRPRLDAAQVVVLEPRDRRGGPLETIAPFSPGFHGGVSVAAGDVNGDGKADVIVATGPGTPGVIRVFSGATKTRLASFGPYPSFTGGVTVSAADVNGDHRAEIVAAPGVGGGSQVKIFTGTIGALLSSFLGATGSGAVTVAAG